MATKVVSMRFVWRDTLPVKVKTMFFYCELIFLTINALMYIKYVLYLYYLWPY